MDINIENREKIASVAIKATKGFRSCILVFFEESLVVVVIDKKQNKELEKNIKKQLKEQKVSLFERDNVRRGYWDNYAEKHAYMSAEELICLSNDNYEIEYENFEKMKLTPYRKNVRIAGEVQDVLGEIGIKDLQKRYHFNHYYFNDNPKYVLLKELCEQKGII